MAYPFQPVDDKCIDCSTEIVPSHERNYIIWDAERSEYKRECAKCHDARLQRPYERRSSSGPIIHSTQTHETEP